jgi:hypothetical protein
VLGKRRGRRGLRVLGAQPEEEGRIRKEEGRKEKKKGKKERKTREKERKGKKEKKIVIGKEKEKK